MIFYENRIENIIVLFLVIFLPVWFLVIDESSTEEVVEVDYIKYHDCYPESVEVTENDCRSRNCDYDPDNDPTCYFKKNRFGYTVYNEDNTAQDRTEYRIESLNSNPVVDDVKFDKLKATTSYISNTAGRITIKPDDNTDRCCIAEL